APRVVTRGPYILLQPAAAQSLALALHELVTNAAKYGALSASAGSIEANWSLASGKLTLHWTEKGGPPVQAPTTPGFGTRIIKASIEGQLGGQATFDWHHDGIRCTLSVPATEGIFAPVTSANQLKSDKPAAACPIAVTGNRILVVEDEALVGIALRDALDEL